MKLKAAFKFQLSGYMKPLIIFYIVIYAILILMSISNAVLSNKGMNARFGCMEIASIIFIFIAGLNAFKSPFHMLLVNGVSRKTMFAGFASSVLPIAGGMALIDSINNLIFSSISNYNSLYSSLYNMRYAANSVSSGMILEGFLWMFFIYAMMAMIGFFITTLYYRMNKPLKLGVSIGVPVLLFVVLPYLDINIFHGLYKAIGSSIYMALGFANGSNPYIAMLSCTIIFALFGCFSYLLMRRATVKGA